MTEISLYNTRTRRKEPLVPLDAKNVRMYVCGPTVYDRAHIGNARPVVVFDVLFRLLRHVAKEKGWGKVTYVRNITDVEDKINARAAETLRPGETELEAIARITAETTAWYHEDMEALGALPPTHEPRATQYIGPMVAMIEALVARGHAYVEQGHVLFAVASYPDYGKLARRSLEDMRAGARVEVAPYKRDPMDFVLWKPSEPTQPGWDSPWGRGRPGWHIECSAMAYELLGPSFDIHGGGIDLAFPHHENEVAQSRCAHPEAGFANVWMHNGFLNVEGEKMSKSLGNFFTVRDLLDKGIPGEVIRFVLLSTHYRQPMDWTQAKADEATATLRRWRAAVDGVDAASAAPSGVVDALADDLNTPRAIAAMHELDEPAALRWAAQLLGLLEPGMGDWARSPSISPEIGTRIEALLAARREARARKDFAKSDAIRALLAMAGIVVEDGKEPEWRVGSESPELAWLSVSELAAQGKTRLSISELKRLAAERHVDYVEADRGHWVQAGSIGLPKPVDLQVLEMAEREAQQ
jgi:cysteinyl-tRNA synthetase